MAHYEDECEWCGNVIRGGWPESEETEKRFDGNRIVDVPTGRLKPEYRGNRGDLSCTRTRCPSHIRKRMRERDEVVT